MGSYSILCLGGVSPAILHLTLHVKHSVKMPVGADPPHQGLNNHAKSMNNLTDISSSKVTQATDSYGFFFLLCVPTFQTLRGIHRADTMRVGEG